MSDSAAHARVGPSSLSRVMICPGSVRECEKLPDVPRMAAAEGSVLHEIAAECLLDPFKEPHDCIGETRFHEGFSFVITDEHADCMSPAIDWLRVYPGELFVEQRVSLDPWMAGQFGTGDVGILEKLSEGDPAYMAPAEVEARLVSAIEAFPAAFRSQPDIEFVAYRGMSFDWKFGTGVPVKVENNAQLKAYALGFLYSVFLPRGIVPITFRLIIEQPRNHEGGRFWEHWDISLEELLAFGEELREVYGRVCDPNAPLVASEKGCQFCDVKDTPQGCPAYNRWMLDFLQLDLDDLDDLDAEPVLQDPALITPERRYYIVKHAKMVEKWLKKLHADSIEAAAAGQPDPGSKLVLGRRGDRFYTDKDAAELILYGALGAQAFNFELKSISQAEKILKPGRKRAGNAQALKFLLDYVDQGEGKPILVDENDPREAYTPAEEYLAELDDEITSFD